MKNTFLKKACAVALAAVMAVTFAPVASLNAFAAPNGTDVTAGKNSGVIGGQATGTVNQPGTYEVIARTVSGITVNLNTANMAAGTYNFKVDGGSETATQFNITGDDPADTAKITINIEGVATGAKGQSFFPNIDFVDTLRTTNYQNLKVVLSGDMHFVERADVLSPAIMAGITTQPIATVVEKGDTNDSDDMYLGNTAISAVQHIDSKAVDVVAYNGPVEVYKLKYGSTARVATQVYRYGTSIKATADDKTALAKVETTLNYKYVVNDNLETSVKLGGTYVEDAYYSGYDAINAGVVNTEVPCKRADPVDKNIVINGRTYGAVRLFSVANRNKLLDDDSVEHLSNWTKEDYLVYKYNPASAGWDWSFDDVNVNTLNWPTVATYDQAITVNQNGEDWTGKYIDAYRFDGIDLNGNGTASDFVGEYTSLARKKDNGQLTGETYYTMDPSSFTKSEDGVALVDGTKYFVTDHTQLSELQYVGGRNASKSVEILRGTEVKASTGNDFAYDTFTNENDLTVTAPVDESLVKDYQTNAEGRAKWVGNEWRAFGAKRNSTRGATDAVFDYPYKDRNETKINNTIYVAQVASGSTMNVWIDPRVKVTKADKLGYFETDDQTFRSGSIVGADWQKVTFGEVAPVTEAFKKAVTAQNSDAEFYASKEIKTVVAGVDPDVVIKGEINADVTDTVNGKNTWDVNTNAAKEKSQVTAHRMYSGREHVYTADPKEIEMLVAAGWKDEGPAFTVNAVASGKGTPIYRLYNKNNGGMHFYTASAAEKDMLLANGWTEGKPVFYGADKATGIPVYRTYNTGSNNGEHNYTTNMAEVEMNVQKGWRAEGVAFYVFK